jgi:DNA-binding helix-hairpin-helix protein with protein kinase domain
MLMPAWMSALSLLSLPIAALAPSLAVRTPVLHAAVRSLEQRLRLSDLRHLRRRREAFERGRKDGVRLGRTAGRLVQLGQRERGKQFITARTLLLSDRDCGLVGLLRVSGIVGIAFQQDVAARPMQEGVEGALSTSFG